MYFYELLEEEKILGRAIESLEKDIHYLCMKRDGEEIDPLIKQFVDHESFESAFIELAETKNRLREVYKNMRKVLMCE